MGTYLQHRLASRLLAAAFLCSAGVACDRPEPDDEPTRCDRGDVRSCDGDGCRGEQRCTGAPAAWGECICPQSAPPDAGPKRLPALATACERDADCPGGAQCLTATSTAFLGGGAPAGLCVAPCQDERDCDPFDAAVCVGTAGAQEEDADGGVDDSSVAAREATGLCFPRCTLGDGAACAGAAHQACAPLGPGGSGGYCRPVCTVDADCMAGTCSPRTGTCMAQSPPVEDDLGAACDAELADAELADADHATAQCSGQCLALDDGFATCARPCIFGEPGDCAPEHARIPGGGCVYTVPGGGLFDLGYCAELCDCDLDCSHPDAICDGFVDGRLEAVLGRKGACTAAALAVRGGMACD